MASYRIKELIKVISKINLNIMIKNNINLIKKLMTKEKILIKINKKYKKMKNIKIIKIYPKN